MESNRAMTDALAPPPKAPAGYAPVRAPDSTRRTSSIDIDWPEGRAGPMRLIGRARDILTTRSAMVPTLCGEAAFEAFLAPDRTVVSIAAEPERAVLKDMVGQRAGGHLRKVIDTLLPEERRAGTPLHLILDDISGTSLIASWAWSLWDPDWLANMEKMKADPKFAGFSRENICAGLRTGSSGLSFSAAGVATEDLCDPNDPDGWHQRPDSQGPTMRRARRIDVRLDDGRIRIDAHFQDSATTPEGGRSALHEYRIRAAADPATLELVMLEAEPRVLPFAECPAAAANVTRLLGTPLPMLRAMVLEQLRGTAGCTHLNDALRALAEVPVLLAHIAHGSPASGP